MSTINKVPASAGAEWLLAGFALLKRAPVPLITISLSGLLVVAFGLVVALIGMLAASALPFPLSFLGSLAANLVLLGVPCIVFSGVVWAAREVAEGRVATLEHLQVGLRHLRPLVVVSLVPVIVTMLCGLLLIALIGPEGAQQTNEVMLKLRELSASGAPPNPQQVTALISALPVLRLMLWVVAVVIITPVVILLVMVAMAEVVFRDRGGMAALRASLSVNLRNFPALVVFSVLLTILMFVLNLALNMVGVFIQLVLGPVIAVLLINATMVGSLMPIIAGAAYTAWRQMLDGDKPASTGGSSPTSTRIEV
ncbi:hypothetical protein LJR168_003649 [Pseudoxanthomonas sp. LjRoot168]|uniref:hypothetical protein n=1 Tax=unclassified Pseudoxanthomonas TaxID=2645906 RepID=UPI0025D543FC|nr:hypothetical protein [Pseudoxanthomonas sp.]